MNDHFKFRAWVQDEKQMLDDISTWTDDYTDMLNETIEYHQDHGVVLMQCTGLKDKNGKLIYEGDIVKIHNLKIAWKNEPTFDWRIVEVKWNRYLWQITNSVLSQPLSDYDLRTLEPLDIEIIGNAWGNPDLLT